MPKTPVARIVYALPLAAAFVLAAALPCAAQGDGEFVFADFEAGLPEGLKAETAEAKRAEDPGAAPSGKAFLELAAPAEPGEAPSVTIPLPAGAGAEKFRALAAWIRTSPAESEVGLRWLALDGAGRALFQRKVPFDAGGTWVRVEEPFALWRWASDAVGDWSEVRAFRLRLESKGVPRVALDRVSLLPLPPGAAAPDGSETVLGTAFPAGGALARRREGFLAATDAPGATEQDLDKVLARVLPVPKWIARAFGDAVRPVSAGRPVLVLVFRDREAFEAFYRRLGTVLRVSIGVPRAGGYAVQDTAGSFFDPQKGMERPVFFHETVHALVARNLRLLPGHESHSWLQEGIANYLQICVYPEAIDRSVYVKNFGKLPDPAGRSFFKPLRALLTGRVQMGHYAQLASLVAFLSSEKPDLLRAFAKGLAGGETAERVLHDAGVSFEDLEKDWMAWGAKTFAPDAPVPPNGEVFPLPPEWASAAKEGE
ncbi:MAG: hypothetical protein MUC63_01740 [Planctomycetes bacterium]|jgi:hypothetical protein|nr:hypothetical protein [Planctomycetota bacterium]